MYQKPYNQLFNLARLDDFPRRLEQVIPCVQPYDTVVVESRFHMDTLHALKQAGKFPSTFIVGPGDLPSGTSILVMQDEELECHECQLYGVILIPSGESCYLVKSRLSNEVKPIRRNSFIIKTPFLLPEHLHARVYDLTGVPEGNLPQHINETLESIPLNSHILVDEARLTYSVKSAIREGRRESIVVAHATNRASRDVLIILGDWLGRTGKIIGEVNHSFFSIDVEGVGPTLVQRGHFISLAS